MVEFIPGVTFAKQYYEEVVRDLIEDSFPNVPYSIGRMGQGSDVLGYDDTISTDHAWGTWLELFLSDSDFPTYSKRIYNLLGENLPPRFKSHSTNWEIAPSGTWVEDSKTTGFIHHAISINTIKSFFERHIGFNPHETPTPADWLVFSEQGLLEVTLGAVFHDGLNQLEAIRMKFDYYPEDVWKYLLSTQWARIAQEEHLLGRAGYIDDELGARIIASRLVRDVMRLCFLMEKKYAPYPKWFGTAFKELDSYTTLEPLLLETLEATDWKTRDKAFSVVLEQVAKLHNDLKITEVVDPNTRPFHGRPFTVIFAERFSTAIRKTISDEKVLELPKYLGSVDQFSDSTDLVAKTVLKQRIKNVYNQ
ncbi:MAG: DUF4037 domain-containing protein [Candidatus Thorarchaeota archaeon]